MKAVIATVTTTAKREMTLQESIRLVKDTVAWHCGLTEEELFWAITEAGEDYLTGRCQKDDFYLFRQDKGFWNWYVQVWCISAKWLIEENKWKYLDDTVSDETYYTYGSRKDFEQFNKYLRAKADMYGFEPVLMSMHHKRIYDGRVFWFS